MVGIAQFITGSVEALMLVAYAFSLTFWSRWLVGRARRGRFGTLVALEPRRPPCWWLVDLLIWFGIYLFVGSALSLVMLRQGWIEAPAELSSPPVPELVSEIELDREPELAPAVMEEAVADAGTPDAGAPDAGAPDAGAPDAGETDDEVIDDEESEDEKPRSLSLAELLAHSVATLLATLGTIGLVLTRGPDALQRLGLLPRLRDLRLGLFAAAVIIPVVSVIMAIVSQLIDYRHDVLDQLAASPSWPVILALSISTAIIAPITEEFTFRVLLQGSLQRIADRGPSDQLDWTPTSTWPIVVTSLLFAALHAGQGPAPIPLFFLSLGLGYLYRQTGRIMPAVIVHMVLNSVTILFTIATLMAGPATP